MDKVSFVNYLEHTLIPDLKQSGQMQTAHDLETCVMFMTGADDIQFDKQTGRPIRSVSEHDKRLIDTLEWRTNHGEWHNT